jgi:acyl-CoA reductase-like NAD-dependent aldehyde dehydrogenase
MWFGCTGRALCSFSEEVGRVHAQQYINGELVEGEGGTISVVSPGTGEVIGEVKSISAAQAQAALEAARDAFPRGRS